MAAETNWNTRSAVEAVSVVEGGKVVGYDLSYAPSAAQYLGEQLAELARPFAPTLIASWSDADDSVLAHIAAVELGIGRTAIDLDLGLLRISMHPQSALRVVLVGTAFDRHPVGPIAELLEGAGHTLAAVASLAPFHPAAAVPAGLETVVLA